MMFLLLMEFRLSGRRSPRGFLAGTVRPCSGLCSSCLAEIKKGLLMHRCINSPFEFKIRPKAVFNQTQTCNI